MNRSPTLDDATPFIGNERLSGTSGGTLAHHYPGTGRPQAAINLAGVSDVDAAVDTARGAFASWRALRPDRRRDILLSVRAAIDEHAGELAQLTTLEMGATRAMAASNPFFASLWFGYYAGWADKIEGLTVPSVPFKGLAYTKHEPYGVVGIFTASNAPLLLMGMKLPAALAAGNCVVLKPPELAPFATLRFAELAVEAGLPPGVLNVVPGAAEAGDRLVRHPDVAKISFTGGLATARKIVAASQDTVKPLCLELGGKSAGLVFADADLDAAIEIALTFSIVANAGQGCAFGTRLLVERRIYEEVLDRARTYLEGRSIGDPLESAYDIGPVASEASCDRIAGIIAEARTDGLRLIAGGSRAGGRLSDGFFIEPTIFADVPIDHPVAREEIFGPVLTVTPFDDEEDAVRLANASHYGLAAFLHTRDVDRVHRLADTLDAGSVFVNGFPSPSPSVPFGGTRMSGFGREGGREGLLEYLRTKSVHIEYGDAGKR